MRPERGERARAGEKKILETKERDPKRECEKERENIKKNIATCYSKVLVVAPYCSKLLKLLRFDTFDVEHILVF